MINYRAMLLYYTKGNTNTQIATICQCSRTTVIKVIKRAKELKLQLPIPDSITDQQLFLMLYPKRGRKTGYYYPDFYLLDKDRKKRSIFQVPRMAKILQSQFKDGAESIQENSVL